ncbi:MAG: glycine--tRNA ligase subunit beta [Deltaproteobacteria bacterium]|nr:glycine--tRNA ligase subunit beta [Deltaproteobacteria bacterium]
MSELLIEIRFEELPATMIGPALTGLAQGVERLLEGVEHGALTTYSTPRRFAVVVEDVAAASPVVERLVTGPPADRAFKDGVPTKGALGFAAGKGVAVEDLEIVDGPKGKVIAARVREGGAQTVEVIAGGLEALVLGLPFAKTMEWGAGGVRFGRPLHGVAAIFGGVPLTGTVAGLAVAPSTEGHRLAPDTAFAFTDRDTWLEGLRARKVEPDIAVRRAKIQALLDEAATRLDADPIRQEALLDEVVHLVEWPVLVLSAFDEVLLHLPPRLLVESMTVHQRYFPVFRQGALTHHFAVISNNPWGNEALIAEGNARVLRARFHDARFFFAEDRKKRLEQHGAGLARMRWIKGLGTMADKQLRVSALAERMAALTGADPALAARAGALCKSDLLAQMVGEFAELQGHMGRLYAAEQGEDPAVAAAIEEHYLPAGGDDDVAPSPVGAAVALADRLDTLVGCFGVGMVPKGGGDPQGLRRAALGVIRTLVGHGLRAELSELFGLAVDTFHHAAAAGQYEGWTAARGTGEAPSGRDELVGALVGFAQARFKANATGKGVSADVVDAVLAATSADPVVLTAKLDAMASITGTPTFKPMMHTFKRVLNITKGAEAPVPSPDQLGDPAELALHQAVERVEAQLLAAAESLDYLGAIALVAELEAPVAAFFDAVLVDAEDPAVKAVRVGLLLRVGRLFLAIADFTLISTR